MANSLPSKLKRVIIVMAFEKPELDQTQEISSFCRNREQVAPNYFTLVIILRGRKRNLVDGLRPSHSKYSASNARLVAIERIYRKREGKTRLNNLSPHYSSSQYLSLVYFLDQIHRHPFSSINSMRVSAYK